VVRRGSPRAQPKMKICERASSRSDTAVPDRRTVRGEATNALVDAENEVQSINRVPIMTGMFVRIERVGDAS